MQSRDNRIESPRHSPVSCIQKTSRNSFRSGGEREGRVSLRDRVQHPHSSTRTRNRMSHETPSPIRGTGPRPAPPLGLNFPTDRPDAPDMDILLQPVDADPVQLRMQARISRPMGRGGIHVCCIPRPQDGWTIRRIESLFPANPKFRVDLRGQRELRHVKYPNRCRTESFCGSPFRRTISPECEHGAVDSRCSAIQALSLWPGRV